MLGLLTIKEVANELKTKTSTVRTWKARGDLPENLFIKIGGTVYCKEDELKGWINKL